CQPLLPGNRYLAVFRIRSDTCVISDRIRLMVHKLCRMPDLNPTPAVIVRKRTSTTVLIFLDSRARTTVKILHFRSPPRSYARAMTGKFRIVKPIYSPTADASHIRRNRQDVITSRPETPRRLPFGVAGRRIALALAAATGLCAMSSHTVLAAQD